MENILTIAAAIAETCKGVQGIKGATAGHVNTVEYDVCPFALVVPAGLEPGAIERSNLGGGSMWIVNFTIEVVIPREGDTPEEWNRVNSLITPLVDRFSTGRTQDRLPTLNGHVDRLEVTGFDPSMLTTHGGTYFYTARIYLNCKFHRRTQT